MSTTKIVGNQDGDNMLIMTESHDKKPGKLTGEGSRKGKKAFSVWIPEELAVAVKILAAKRRVSIQELTIEFLNDGLRKYGSSGVEDEPKTKN